MRIALTSPVMAGILLAVLLMLGSCGKGDDPAGPDLRTPPPIPPPRAASGAGSPHIAPEPQATQPFRTPSPSADAPPPPPVEEGAEDKPRGVPVKAAVPLQRTVAITVDYTGQTVGSETVQVRARVEGFLLSYHFVEGSFIKKGDLLYEIDKDKANEIVEQAVGEYNIAMANLGKAQGDVARNTPLLEKNAISKEEYETSVAAEKAAKASVDACQAAVNRARINLGYATVRAPVDGLIGKNEVDVGNLVGRGEPTLLTTISRIDPIYVNIRVGEADLLRYQRKRREAGKAAKPDISLFFSDKSEHPYKGTVAVIDRNVDPATGTLLVRVSFPNPDRLVRPGQFARVQGVQERIENALLVPQGAVEELQGSYRVYLVGAEDFVEVRSVVVGRRMGALWVISEGLAAEDRVIVEGRQKIRAGVRVAPQVVEIFDAAAPEKKSPGSR